DENNNLYTSALEFLVPTGARLRIGYNLRDLQNNLQFGGFTNCEYQPFMGGNLVQPVLKNPGPAVTRFPIRLADLNAEIAWQDYRRSLSQVMGGAEIAYLVLHLAKKQVKALGESVKGEETVVRDYRAQADVGKASQLDVLQAEADLSSRRTGRNDA